MMYEFGLLGDLLPELAAFIDKDGGVESSTWKYLATLDRYEKAMRARGVEVSNGMRAAVLFAAMARARPGHAYEIVGTMMESLRIPKTTYFTAVLLLDSVKRLEQPPQKSRRRIVHNREFPDILDFNRIVARTEGRDESVLDQWDAQSRQACKKQGENHE